MQQLTDRQQQVLNIITSYIGRFGTPPSQREIAGELGVNGTLGIMKHLNALEKKGYLNRREGSSRGIVLPAPPSQAVSLPVVGVVRAGTPEPAIEDIEGFFSIDLTQDKNGKAFFLRVKGDSMIEAGILEGDLALVLPQSTAENRDIVVAMVNGEATLKRFFREKNRIRLQPENRTMQPIILRPGKDEVSIIGKVTGLYRKF
ncbi:MAG: transcriptional repressor LexA [Deltaproteobacteria bacterium]|nr:transcriptional repressor LexA [Deltaproteobacteria bacterium]